MRRTEPERVADEHIAWRRARGASWDDLAKEARYALQQTGWKPREFEHQHEIARAFATAWRSIMSELIER